MRVLAQRVASARVEVEGEVSGAIGAGLLLLVGVEDADGEADIAWLSVKLSRGLPRVGARLFRNRSLIESGGEVLAVSQFTLFASLRKGNRPAWSRAAGAEISRPLFDRFVRQLEHDLGRKVETGVFGADMQIHLVNDGPVTIAIDSRNPE